MNLLLASFQFSLVFTLIATIPVLYLLIMGTTEFGSMSIGESPAERLFDITKGKEGSYATSSWVEEIRYIPRLIQVQLKTLCIIELIIFALSSIAVFICLKRTG